MRVSGARPFVVTHLQMGSSSCHPFRRFGALTGGLRPPAAICTSFGLYSPLSSLPKVSSVTLEKPPPPEPGDDPEDGEDGGRRWSRVKGITFSWAVIGGQAGGRPWSSGATGKL